MSMYYASKHAVSVLTEGLRQELNGLKSKIRVAVRNKKLPNKITNQFYAKYDTNRFHVASRKLEFFKYSYYKTIV